MGRHCLAISHAATKIISAIVNQAFPVGDLLGHVGDEEKGVHKRLTASSASFNSE